jgi:divalent metal cation (Fe/Co/Zn/Cd) transporter
MLFGLDSIIEVAAVFLVMWRLSGARTAANKERLACGSIGVLLILLACAAISASIVHLVQHALPESTVPGLIISAVSFFDMLLLSAAKFYLGRKLQSQCLISDAKCSLMCSSLSLCLLVGSVAFLLQPRAWWVDAAAALALSVLILKEGIDMLRNALSSNFVMGGCC